jgi:hypothetical protein
MENSQILQLHKETFQMEKSKWPEANLQFKVLSCQRTNIPLTMLLM